jgi:Co/Zn/Cd efflux system component
MIYNNNNSCMELFDHLLDYKATSAYSYSLLPVVMSPSRTARLYFLLVLDLLFFVLEISIGKLSRSSERSSC